ncbi:MAG: SDR family oxidoreductase [Bdellovibrionota bacterium]
MANVKKIALVTGANRGIGLETCRQLAADHGVHVLLTSRNAAAGEAAAKKLTSAGVQDITTHQLDTTDEKSVQRLSHFVLERFGRLDILVNNAGILPDEDTGSALEANLETIRRVFETNTLGSFRMCQVFAPMMRKHCYGRIVNLSSGMGQLSEMNGGYAAYRISKTALNAVTRIFASELGDSGILVNSVCPGWVRTEMGGAGAERDVSQGADTVVWLATLKDGGPSGGFFRDREPIAW